MLLLPAGDLLHKPVLFGNSPADLPADMWHLPGRRRQPFPVSDDTKPASTKPVSNTCADARPFLTAIRIVHGCRAPRLDVRRVPVLLLPA